MIRDAREETRPGAPTWVTGRHKHSRASLDLTAEGGCPYIASSSVHLNADLRRGNSLLREAFAAEDGAALRGAERNRGVFAAL